MHAGDFFGHAEFGQYDAAVGNPPYVRYQGWTGEARAASLQAALRAGVNLTNLASSWAAFTVHSALHLRAGGRLGLVLPAELLTVNYAAPVRQFLMDHFADVTLVLFEERVFPGVEVEAVLLLADDYDPDGRRGTDHMSLIQVRDASDLTDLAAARRWTPPTRGARWSAGLMSSQGLAAYSAATAHDGFAVLETWGDTTLGMVTGNNKFFTLSPAKVRGLGLTASDTIRLSPPGSRHLRALTLTKDGLARLGEDGEATYLFRPDGEPSAAAWRYIKSGEDLDVHTAYKCRVRKPWWRTPVSATGRPLPDLHERRHAAARDQPGKGAPPQLGARCLPQRRRPRPRAEPAPHSVTELGHPARRRSGRTRLRRRDVEDRAARGRPPADAVPRPGRDASRVADSSSAEGGCCTAFGPARWTRFPSSTTFS